MRTTPSKMKGPESGHEDVLDGACHREGEKDTRGPCMQETMPATERLQSLQHRIGVPQRRTRAPPWSTGTPKGITGHTTMLLGEPPAAVWKAAVASSFLLPLDSRRAQRRRVAIAQPEKMVMGPS